MGEPPTFNTGLTIAQSYKQIPHRQTVFDFDRANLSDVDRDYLDLMFYLIDEGVRLRVHGVRKGPRDRTVLRFVIDGYEEIYSYMKAIKPPQHLLGYHQFILAAFNHQRSFFKEAYSQGSGFNWRGLANHSQVRAASAALIKAYNLLKSRFSSQDRHNQDALFDYHCALDFV